MRGGEWGFALVVRESSHLSSPPLIFTTFPRPGRKGALQQLPSIRLGGRFENEGGVAWLDDYDLTLPLGEQGISVAEAEELQGRVAEFYLVSSDKYQGEPSEWTILHRGRIDRVNITPEGVRVRVISEAYYRVRGRTYPPLTIGEIDASKNPIEPGKPAPCAFGVFRAKGVLWSTSDVIFLLGDYTAWKHKAIHRLLRWGPNIDPHHPPLYFWEHGMWVSAPTYLFRSGAVGNRHFTGEVGATIYDIAGQDFYSERTLAWLRPTLLSGLIGEGAVDLDAGTAGNRIEDVPYDQDYLVATLSLGDNDVYSLPPQVYLRWRYRARLNHATSGSYIKFWAHSLKGDSEVFSDYDTEDKYVNSLKSYTVANQTGDGDSPPLKFTNILFSRDYVRTGPFWLYVKFIGDTDIMSITFFEVMFEAYLPIITKDVYIEGAWRCTPRSWEMAWVDPKYRIWDGWPFTGQDVPTENPVCVIRSILRLDLELDGIDESGMLEAYKDTITLWRSLGLPFSENRQPLPLAFQVLENTTADRVIDQVCKQAGLIFFYGPEGESVRFISPLRREKMTIDASLVVEETLPQVRVEWLPERKPKKITVRYNRIGGDYQDYMTLSVDGFQASGELPEQVEAWLSEMRSIMADDYEDFELTINAPYVHDDYMAFFLLWWTFWWRRSARRRLSLRTIGETITLRPGDVVRVDLPQLGVRAEEGRWLVEEVRINPSSAGWTVDLNLLEVSV